MEPKSNDQMLLSAAHSEQARMRAAVAQLQPGGTVRITRDQFVHLAELIDRLAKRKRNDDTDGFDVPVDGIRWWVPLSEFQRTRAELDDLRAQRDGISLDPLMVRSSLY